MSEIRNRFSGAVICSGECSVKELVENTEANLRVADLRWADLSGADLSGADLRWADLSGADLSGDCNRNQTRGRT